ncbi:Metallo-dependent phosphatase, partial [Neoconidiobolus thromboides FSU 785]
ICSGSHKVFADIYLEILQGFNLKNHLQSQMVCYTLGNICPFPNLNLKELKLPEVSNKPKVINESNKTDIGYILHISDLHYDENYIEGSEADCSEPICCQVDSKSKGLSSNKVKKPASKWGDYKCDSNINMLKSMFKAINELHNSKYKLDMVIFNGDIPAHDFWKHNLTAVTNTEIKSYKLLNFSDINIYPTIGNHEVLPNNFVPLNLQISDDKGEESEYYFYRFVAEQWSNWLPKKSIDDVRKGGYYSVKHANNLKLINLNNNLCYVNNFYLLLNFTHQNNPNNMLKWLINELKDAEDNNMNVYISSHIPPNSLDCLPSYSMQYYQILNRFHSIIKGQFYGHDHHDEFSVYYDNNNKKTSKRVISNQYLTPSITTLNGQNPGFRIYKVNKKNWEILDYYQYYTQLKDSHMYKEDLKWKLLYTAKGLYDPNNDFNTLSPEFWHNSIVNLSKNQTLFDLFYGYRNKLGLKRKKCNLECRSNYICSMVANHSKDTC